MALKYVQTLTLYQAGAGNIIGATSVVLTTLTDIYGNAITSMTPFGTKGYITLEPDTTNEEGATFTGITVNANGTTTLTGVSTILAQAPYTETSGLVRQHAGGSKVVVTDNVAFWNTFGNKNNDETLTGRWGTAVVPSAGNDLANKTYVDGVAVAGAPNANPTTKGIVQEATQAQVLAKTATGSTGADLYVTPPTLPSTLLSDYRADTGSANAYVITPAPAITAYTVGQIFSFKAVNANTTVSTLNVNALGVKTIKKGGSLDLAAGDISAGLIVVVEYDGTNFQLVSAPAIQPITQNSKEVYATDSVGTDSYAITLVPAVAAYVLGQTFTFKAGTANTGAATLAVNGLTATAIVKKGNVALNTGDILSGQIVQVTYDGTNFQMVSPQTLTFYGLAASGATTYNIATASGVQNIPHGLGVTPKLFKVMGVMTNSLAYSFNGNSVYERSVDNGAQFLISSDLSSATTNYQTAVITADATNIILTWTKISSPTGTIQLIWEALA